MVKTYQDSYGGPVWDLKTNHARNTIAAACEDGSVRLFTPSEDSGLQFLRAFSRQEGNGYFQPLPFC